jgi:hypothetical protein
MELLEQPLVAVGLLAKEPDAGLALGYPLRLLGE